MIILVNPLAGAGCGLARWHTIEPQIRALYGEAKVLLMDRLESVQPAVCEAAESGDPRIVAAGGDGTANAVVNAIMRLDPFARSRCVLGAIGLGSSNDFHKPFIESTMMGRFPSRLAFDRARLCDVSLLRYSCNGEEGEKFFFLNASAGITAAGNARFNKPGFILKFLKRTNVPSAIVYAALSSLLLYKNQPVRLSSPALGTLSTSITNLGILKNPHFSGELRYDAVCDYSNGRFVVVACSEMNIPQRYALFRALQEGSLSGLEQVRTWSTPALDLESESPIAVELDGEIVMAQKAHFEVQPHALRVCP